MGFVYHTYAQYGRLTLLLGVWLAVPSPAVGESSPPESGKDMPPVVSRLASVPKEPAPIEHPVQSMPDNGPRLEGQSSGIDGLAWQEGYAAFKRGAWQEARRFFEKIVNDHPQSPLIPSARAFLVEVSLREDPPGQSRADSIQAYTRLLQEYPQSVNARRAMWRIADLYLAQGALQEAQAFYEQALAQSQQIPFDGSRALLGLGYTFMAMGKWNDAEHAFADARKRSDHESLLQRATLGLAHALFQQQRLSEAQGYYDLSYRRWTTFFKLDPLAIQRYAATQIELRHWDSARELMLLFYNLYPRHEYAPTAVLNVAESLRSASKPELAEFFYALVPSLYARSSQETTAQLQLATLRAERMLPAEENAIGLSISAMIHNVPIPDQSNLTYRSMLERIATLEADSSIKGEALFHLGIYYERTNDMTGALRAYKEATFRSGKGSDPWPMKASERLSALLTPWIEAAIASHDDLTVVSLFYRYGSAAEHQYASSPLLFEIAEAHRRLGFFAESLRLYQQLVKSYRESARLEPALVGLGKTYLDQQDPEAARKVLERYRFQFPIGKHEQEVLRLLVQAMRQQRDHESVLHLCRTWLLRHQEHRERPAMYLQLAATLGEVGKLDASAIAYEEALKAGASKSIDTLLSYADTLSRLNRHQKAIAAYQAVIDGNPPTEQAEWAHLQTAKHWSALKQYDRATIALAELGVTDDPIMNRLSASLKNSFQAARRAGIEEGL